MKRSNSDTESLVYAYGCGQPSSGWLAAEAENERCGILWDALVRIEREYDADMLAAARADAGPIDDAARAIDAIRSRLRETKTRAKKQPVRAELRALERELWPLLSVWRRASKETCARIEADRRARVVAARHETECWWPNYNAVIQRYETARKEVRKRGRRLRLRDITRDDGCMTVQIQRTRTGLGAAADELQDGTLSTLTIGRVSDMAYDPHAAFRCRRDRMCQTTAEMRVDSAGNRLRLPVWMHRRIPDDCRVKSAQIVWRPRGERLEYWLCLTISRPRPTIAHPMTQSSARARIDIGMEDNRHLRVARVQSWGPHAGQQRIELDPHWLAMMDRTERLQAVLSDDSAPDRARIRARMELPGLRTRLQRRRREHYRLTARSIAQNHARIVIETPPLSEDAYLDRGADANSLRHRACAHALVAEIQHQGRKHGCDVETVIAERAASAPVPRRVQRRRNNDLAASFQHRPPPPANEHPSA